MKGFIYNICFTMNENESNYEIIVTKNEYDRLNSDMSALK